MGRKLHRYFDVRVSGHALKRLGQTGDPRGNYLATVKAEAGALAGVSRPDDTGQAEIYRPDMVTVRDSLPHVWRKAWDRAGNPWWPTGAGKDTAHLVLKDRRGNQLARILLTYREVVSSGFLADE